MENKRLETIIESLLDKIEKLQSETWLKEFRIGNLKAENEKLNNLLNPPTTKGDKEDE